MAKPVSVPKPTLAKMIDELGTIDEQLKRLVPRMKELKELMKTYGPGAFDGKEFVVTNTPGKMTFYKTELLEQHVAETLLKKCEVTTAYLKVTTSRKMPANRLRAISISGK